MKRSSLFTSWLLFLFVMSCTPNGDSENPNSTGASQDTAALKTSEVERYGMVIGLKEDKIDEYKQLHANAWPEVLEQLTESNIQNYSIYLHKIEDKYYLFSYYEYGGDNYQEDMRKMAADSATQAWWELTDSYQTPLDSSQKGEWWTTMEEIFHHN